MDEVLTLPQAAIYLHMHPVTLRNMMHRKNHPPGRKLGGRWKFHKTALDAYLTGEKWQEVPTPSLPAERRASTPYATPSQTEREYLSALGLQTEPSQRNGRRSCMRKPIARAA